jgi:alpha-methylacyl-CoA racemase
VIQCCKIRICFFNQYIIDFQIDGSAYIGSFVYKSRDFWQGERGENLLDTGAHFYDTYQTLDGKHVAVGAIEPKFYQKLLKGKRYLII